MLQEATLRILTSLRLGDGVMRLARERPRWPEPPRLGCAAPKRRTINFANRWS